MSKPKKAKKRAEPVVISERILQQIAECNKQLKEVNERVQKTLKKYPDYDVDDI